MKKLLGLLLVVIIFTVGCSNTESNNDKGKQLSQLEQDFKVAGEKFFENYMLGIGQTNNVITLQMMYDVNELNIADKIDVSTISHCTKDSFVNIITNELDEVIDYEFNLECE